MSSTHTSQVAAVLDGIADGSVEIVDLTELLERTERLLQWHPRIEIVRQVQVNALHSESLEARVELPHDALGREPGVGARIHRVVRLRGDQGPHAARLDPAADRSLAPSPAICVRGIEVRDAELPRRVHQRQRLVVGHPLPEQLRRRPNPAEVAASKGDAGQRQRRHSNS